MTPALCKRECPFPSEIADRIDEGERFEWAPIGATEAQLQTVARKVQAVLYTRHAGHLGGVPVRAKDLRNRLRSGPTIARKEPRASVGVEHNLLCIGLLRPHREVELKVDRRFDPKKRDTKIEGPFARGCLMNGAQVDAEAFGVLNGCRSEATATNEDAL